MALTPPFKWPGHGLDGYVSPPEPPPPPEPDRTPIECITLPCHHAQPTPMSPTATVTCHCGVRWRLVKEHGGQSWGATKIT